MSNEIRGNSYKYIIDGWNLDQFCREEYWKLRRSEPIANGLTKEVEYHEFTPEEKKSVLAGYSYESILKYQNQILLFMINLCEIMEFVTEQKGIPDGSAVVSEYNSGNLNTVMLK